MLSELVLLPADGLDGLIRVLHPLANVYVVLLLPQAQTGKLFEKKCKGNLILRGESPLFQAPFTRLSQTRIFPTSISY